MSMWKKAFIIIVSMLLVLLLAGCDGKKVVTADGRTNNDLKAECQSAQSLINEGEYEDAIAILNGIPETYNKYSDVVSARNNAVGLYVDEIVGEADELLKEDKHKEALELLSSAKHISGENPLIEAREETIKKSYRDAVIKEAKALYDSKDYEVAMALLNDSAGDIEKNDEFNNLLNECAVEYTLEKVKILEDEGEKDEALGLLKKQIDALGGNEVLNFMFEERVPDFKKKLFEEAEIKYYDEGYSAAIALLQGGKNIIGNDSDIEAKISHYEDLKSKEPMAFSEKDASYQGGLFIKKGDGYYRLQRGGEYSNTYSCSELNMACTDVTTERIPVLTGNSQLVVFTNSLPDVYHVIPIQEIAFTFPVGLRKPGDGTYWGHTFGKTVNVYSNDSNTVEQYDIGDRDYDGLTIEEIGGMTYDEYWGAYGFDTQEYCDPSATFHWGSWGERIIKMQDVTTVKFSFYQGTQYYEGEMTSYVKYYGFNGLNEGAAHNYTATLGKTSFATIDVSDLSSGLYVIYGEYKGSIGGSKSAVYLFEKR